MKTLRNIGFIAIFIALTWMIVTYTPKADLVASELEMIHEMSYANASDESIEWTEDTYQNRGLTIYVNEMKRTHLELKQTREGVIEIVEDLKFLKASFEENNIELTEADRVIIKESYLKIRLYRYMLEDTIGKGYQQLLDLKENKDLYSKEQSKDILSDVYLVLQARIQLFNDIQVELINIQNTLEQY